MAPAAWKAVPGDPFAEIAVGYMLDVLEFREQSVVEVPLGARATAVVGQLIVSPEGVDEAVNVTPPAKLKVLDRVTLREMPVCPTLMFLPTKLIVKSPTWTVPLAVCEVLPGEPAPVTKAT